MNPNNEDPPPPGRSLRLGTPLQPLSTFVQAITRGRSSTSRSPSRTRRASTAMTTAKTTTAATPMVGPSNGTRSMGASNRNLFSIADGRGGGSRGGTPRKAATIANARLAAMSGKGERGATMMTEIGNSNTIQRAESGPRMPSALPLPPLLSSDVSSSEFVGNTPTARFHHQNQQIRHQAETRNHTATIQDTIIAKRPVNRLASFAASTVKARRLPRQSSNIFLRQLENHQSKTWAELVWKIIIQVNRWIYQIIVSMIVLPITILRHSMGNKNIFWIITGVGTFLIVAYAIAQLDWKIAKKIGDPTLYGDERRRHSTDKQVLRNKEARKSKDGVGNNDDNLQSLNHRISILEEAFSAAQTHLQGTEELNRRNYNDIQSKLIKMDEKEAQLELKLSNMENDLEQVVRGIEKLRIAQVEAAKEAVTEIRQELERVRKQVTLKKEMMTSKLKDQIEANLMEQLLVKKSDKDGKIIFDPDLLNAILNLFSNKTDILNGDVSNMIDTVSNTTTPMGTTMAMTMPTLQTIESLLDGKIIKLEERFANRREIVNLVQELIKNQFEEWRKMDGAEKNQWRQLITSMETKIPDAEGIKVEFQRIKRELKEVMERKSSWHPEDEMADYALETMGSRVVATLTSPSYMPKNEKLQWTNWLISLVFPYGQGKAPRVALTADNSLGNCWAFNGPIGNFTVALGQPIIPTHISIDHLSPLLQVDRTSAPRIIKIYALQSSQDQNDGVLLGRFEYLLTGPAVQTFELQLRVSQPVRLIKLTIMNNHGRKEYTCLYRFRVHSFQDVNLHNRSSLPEWAALYNNDSQ